jgi:serine/threonine protein kinase
MSPASHVSTDKTLELQPIDSACPNCNAIGIDWKLAVCPKCGWCLEPVEFGSYRAEVLLGEGGMGRVYRAVDDKLGRRVAVKTLLPHLVGDVGTMARFERESKLAASLRHPNLVSIFEVGRTSEDAPYLVMEYIEGRSLKQLLVAEAPLQPSRAVFLCEQLLAGLGEAHARGVVHRDLKPANVLVTMLSDGTELCKVVDFGIARQVSGEETDRRLTKTGLLVGTPGYMAPEQIESMECDHRIDLYAVGSVLYELLTGARPFRGSSEAEVLMKTMTELPVPPSRRVSSDISSGLDAIVLKALSKKPEDRFGSALEFRQALRTRKTGEEQSLTSSGDGLVIDRTPLAAAQLGQQARPNPRSIFSSLLEATDDWSRSRMLEPFQSAVETAIAERDEAELTALFRQVAEASKGATSSSKTSRRCCASSSCTRPMPCSSGSSTRTSLRSRCGCSGSVATPFAYVALRRPRGRAARRAQSAHSCDSSALHAGRAAAHRSRRRARRS